MSTIKNLSKTDTQQFQRPTHFLDRQQSHKHHFDSFVFVLGCALSIHPGAFSRDSSHFPTKYELCAETRPHFMSF